MNTHTLQSLKKMLPLLLVLCFPLGIFCRWYQVKNELLFDGSLAQGAFMQWILPILALTFLAGFGFAIYGLKNLPRHKDCFPPTLTFAITLPAGTLLLIGNVLRFVSNVSPTIAYTEVSEALTGALPYLGILAGLCIVLFGVIAKIGKTPSPLLFMAVSIYLVVQLIVYFQAWNMDPSIHDYAYKLLAAIFTMLGCFQISGFGFGKGKRRITILWCIGAAFFNGISLPDHLTQSPVEVIVSIAFLLLAGCFALLLFYAPEPPEEAPSDEPSLESPQQP